jgi:hypothetical protein
MSKRYSTFKCCASAFVAGFGFGLVLGTAFGAVSPAVGAVGLAWFIGGFVWQWCIGDPGEIC